MVCKFASMAVNRVKTCDFEGRPERSTATLGRCKRSRETQALTPSMAK
jgi:hypothetical protein